MKIPFAAALTAGLLALSNASHAGVVLDDSFNTENGGNGAGVYSGFANWTAADVDLLAPGFFYALCQTAGGSTPCVDMEGNGNGSLTTRAAYTFSAGTTVDIRFDYAGDQRSAPNNGLMVSLVSTTGQVVFQDNLTAASDAGFARYAKQVVLSDDVSLRLAFLSTGPADSKGLLIDNVLLSGDVVAPAVPEPASALLMLAGVAGLATRIKKRR